ncbi:MAG: glycosyltransferase family 2 protein [Armatimonadetes bacterium]|nr:glycosyltransferase family 2 protein [Armatimonadota bacterium]
MVHQEARTIDAPAEKTRAGMLARYVYDLTNSQRRRDRKKVRQSLVLPRLPHGRRVPGSVWAVSTVRNVVDIIGDCVTHMLAQEVDHVLIVDNGSTDGTLEVLRGLEKDARVHVAVDPREGHFQQARINLLSREAARAGADWIVPFDADEFWFARGDTVASWLKACRVPVVGAEIYNLFPKRVPSTTDRGVHPYRLDLTPQGMKVAYRAHRLAHVGPGNHIVSRSGKTSLGLYIAHVPWRSKEQLIRKARQGALAHKQARTSPTTGYHLKAMAAMDDGRLEELWGKILDGESTEEICWYPIGPFRDADVLAWKTWDPDGLTSRPRDKHLPQVRPGA